MAEPCNPIGHLPHSKRGMPRESSISFAVGRSTSRRKIRTTGIAASGILNSWDGVVIDLFTAFQFLVGLNHRYHVAADYRFVGSP
jgi:hypothetical protein